MQAFPKFFLDEYRSQGGNKTGSAEESVLEYKVRTEYGQKCGVVKEHLDPMFTYHGSYTMAVLEYSVRKEVHLDPAMLTYL